MDWDPVFGREVVERQQHVGVVGGLGGRLGELGAELAGEALRGRDGMVAVSMTMLAHGDGGRRTALPGGHFWAQGVCLTRLLC